MKLFSDFAKTFIPQNQPPTLIHAINNYAMLKYLDTPTMSDQLSCPMCSGTKGIYCLIDPKTSDEKMWFCMNGDCLKNYKMYPSKAPEKKPKRARDWKEFCLESKLGDLDFEVVFENVQQSAAKIEFMRGFAKAPKGLLIMQGKPGTGKTYAALALCELFTRDNTSCIFETQKMLIEDYKRNLAHNSYNFRERLSTCPLLVVDDFGTEDPPPGFMSYFMDILDTRMRWSNRGTVITSNLEGNKLSKVVGESLADRFKTAQFFKFEGDSRRPKKVL